MNANKKNSAHIRGRQKRKTQQTAPTMTSAFEKALESLADAKVAVREWIQRNGLDDKKEKHELEESAIAISHLLRSDKASKRQPTSTEAPVVIEGFGDFLVFRDGRKRLIIAAPVDIINCDSQRYQPEKNIAFFRMKGAYFPQLYAISGKTPCIEPHRKVMDSKYWTEQIRELGNWHGHFFKSNGWDVAHGWEKGDGFACHAELQAMLGAAFALLQQSTGKEPSVGKLYLLRKLEEGNEVDLHISENPCKGCWEFLEMLETITGINFNVTVMQNLGILKKAKNQKKELKCPKYGWNGVDTESEEIEEPPRGQAQVVIWQKPPQEIFQSKPSPAPKQLKTKVPQETEHQSFKTKTATSTGLESRASLANSPPGMVVSKVHRETITSTWTTKTEIQQMKRRKRKIGSLEDSDNDEYEPRSISKDHPHNASPKRKSLRTGLLTPNYSPRLDIADQPDQYFRDNQKMRNLSRDFKTALKKARYV